MSGHLRLAPICFIHKVWLDCIYRSRDGGESFVKVGLPANFHVNHMISSPVDSKRVFMLLLSLCLRYMYNLYFMSQKGTLDITLTGICTWTISLQLYNIALLKWPLSNCNVLKNRILNTIENTCILFYIHCLQLLHMLCFSLYWLTCLTVNCVLPRTAGRHGTLSNWTFCHTVLYYTQHSQISFWLMTRGS